MSGSFCSEALRTIGHNLDLRGIRTFLIRCEADLFVVEGGYQVPPAITPVTVHYTFCDIARLDREAQERNDHVSSVKDFVSLAEILWAAAIYVNGRQGRLVSVSNTASTELMPILTIEYETAQNGRVVEDFRGSAIYELCITIYKLRDTSHKTGQYTRFSTLHESNQARH
jgi:hypothetical protein